MSPHPPTWAQWLVSSVLPARTRDSVLGDLLEEYAESQVPRHGTLRADWWYLRQVAGFLWRASRVWALVIGVQLGTRAIIDTTMPTTDDFRVRATVSTYLALTLFTGLGLYTGWHTRRVLGAAVIAIGTAVIGCSGSVIVPATITALLSLGALHSVPSYSGLHEAFDVPVIAMAIVGAVLASCGALIGRTGHRDSGLRIPG